MNKKHNFKDILEGEIVINSQNKTIQFDKIEIPMIQRDYAQGRGFVEKKKLVLNETGKKFIDVIFEALIQKKDVDMNFVYGSVVTNLNEKTKKEEYTFEPIDGQQRLTTLFLLYWYIGSRELSPEESSNLMVLLIKFTYSTRVSSRRFCELLCQTKLSFTCAPSEEICNFHWFFSSYKKDPTIKALLNMLDTIHEKYNSVKNPCLYADLAKLHFNILILNGFNMTEDLYIKMNARGKQLSAYENFKADLIKWMGSSTNPENSDFNKEVVYDNRKTPYYLSISQKLDNKWTFMIWQITKDKEKTDDKLVDPIFLSFFYRYFLNRFITLSKADNGTIEKDEDFQYFSSEKNTQNFDVFKKYFSYKEIIVLEKILDILANNWDEIHRSITPSWNLEEADYSFFNTSITQKERVIMLAITLYLEKNDTFNEILFKQWMRIVWNIVENTDINDYNSAIGVMRLIIELSDHSSHIYQYLSDPQINIISSSSKNAVDEEKLKCIFIFTNNAVNQEWEKAFIEAEKHRFFKGAIGFLINEKMTIADFRNRYNSAKKVFDEKGINNEYQKNGHIFLRALISRYKKSEQFLERNYIDTDEGEHYLKKMLASDDVVKDTLKEWFSLKSENDLNDILNSEVAKESQMLAWGGNDPVQHRRLRKIHETLYKNSDLQNWMQEKGAIRLDWRGSRVYISRRSSWYDWIMVDGYRNEIISKLLENNSITTTQQCTYNGEKIPFFWGNDYIILQREILIINEKIIFTYQFNNDFLQIGIKETEQMNEKFSGIQFLAPVDNDYGEKSDGWICRKKYNYQEEVKDLNDISVFLSKIESEVFGDSNSLFSKIKQTNIKS